MLKNASNTGNNPRHNSAAPIEDINRAISWVYGILIVISVVMSMYAIYMTIFMTPRAIPEIASLILAEVFLTMYIVAIEPKSNIVR